MRCSRCKMMYYCNVECQRKHWKKHKKECKRVKEEQKSPKSASIQHNENEDDVCLYLYV